MRYCNLLQKYSRKPRTKKRQNKHDKKKNCKKSGKYSDLIEWIRAIWWSKNICKSNAESSEEESYPESHTIPCIREHIRHSISPEIYREECYPESDEVEGQGRQRQRIKAKIGVLFFCALFVIPRHEESVSNISIVHHRALSILD